MKGPTLVNKSNLLTKNNQISIIMVLNDKTAIKSGLRKSYSEVVYAINQMDDMQFLTPRSEGNWSSGDILGHLLLTTKAIAKGMSAPKDILKSQFGIRERQEWTKEELYSNYLKGLANTGLKAPPNVVYNGVAETGKEKLIVKFSEELDILIGQIDNWTEHELSSLQLPHPAIGNLTVREMLFFIELHNYHHLNQIKEVISNSIPAK